MRFLLIVVHGLVLLAAAVLIFGYEGRAQALGYALMTIFFAVELLRRYADWRRKERQ